MSDFKIRQGGEPLMWLLSEHAKLERELGPLPDLAQSSTPASAAHDDAPMRIADLLRLDEFKGALTKHALRAGIADGSLRHERYGRRIVVTPSAVRAWRKDCRSPNHPDSGSSQPNMPTARSESTPSGASKTAAAASSLAALKASAKLRN